MIERDSPEPKGDGRDKRNVPTKMQESGHTIPRGENMIGIYMDEEIDVERGLSKEQVSERILANRENVSVKSATKSRREIVKESVFTYFNFLFFLLAVLLAMVGAWSDMLFLFVIVANTLIGMIQKLHAKKVLDGLADQAIQNVTVVRNGRKETVPADKLVLDDVVWFCPGDQIVADALVVEKSALVNEALITGEADEIKKTAGDMLLSGSFVVSGEVKAVLVAVGEESYLSGLTMKATMSKEEELSEMIRSLDNLILVIGIILVPIGIALFVQSYRFNGQSLFDSVTGMVAAVIGMIPEGLYLLSSVAMGTMRLAKKNVLVHDMRCIETLARADVMCVDKTGTITEPGMMVYRILIPDCLPRQCAREEGEKRLVCLVKSMDADNVTMEAIREYYREWDKEYETREVIGFSSKNKYSAVLSDGFYYVLGAPEKIWANHDDEMEQVIENYSAKGFRVLAFGMCESLEEGENPKAELLAFLILANPIRENARETFAYFADNGVEIKVISGDYPLTVSAIAQDAGIAGAQKYVDASTLNTWEDYFYGVEKYNIFGRVTPEQKKILVQALKARGKTVAMTGDGVNDVLALKIADCSIAMASGSDAASTVSQLVLMDSDFSRMPSVVAEGRRAVNNLQKTAALYIAKNIFSLLLAFFSVLLMWDYPLVPSQVTLISAFTIGIPSVMLTLEQNQKPIRGHFLANVLLRAFPAGVTSFVIVAGLVTFSREFQVDLECLSTSCTILVTAVGFLILYQIAKPLKKQHIMMFVGLLFGWLFCMTKVGEFFSITAISKQCAMLTVLFLLIAEPVLYYLTKVVSKLYSKITLFREK